MTVGTFVTDQIYKTIVAADLKECHIKCILEGAQCHFFAFEITQCHFGNKMTSTGSPTLELVSGLNIYSRTSEMLAFVNDYVDQKIIDIAMARWCYYIYRVRNKIVHFILMSVLLIHSLIL